MKTYTVHVSYRTDEERLGYAQRRITAGGGSEAHQRIAPELDRLRRDGAQILSVTLERAAAS